MFLWLGAAQPFHTCLESLQWSASHFHKMHLLYLGYWTEASVSVEAKLKLHFFQDHPQKSQPAARPVFENEAELSVEFELHIENASQLHASLAQLVYWQDFIRSTWMKGSQQSKEAWKRLNDVSSSP